MIAMPAAATVYRACIEASPATDAFQRIPEILTAEVDAAAVIDKHDMDLLSRPRPPEMARIRRDRLTGGAPRQQTQKDTEMPPQRNQLFDTHAGDVHIGQVRTHIRIAFIGTDDKFPGLRHCEIDARERRPPRQKFFPQVQSCRMREELRIGITGGRPEVFMEDLSDLLFLFVDARQYDMARRLAGQLYHPLAKIGIDDLHAALLQEFIEATFLRQHGLAFDHPVDPMPAKDRQYDRIVLRGVGRPVYLDAVFSGSGLKLLQVSAQPRQHVFLDRGSRIAERLPVRDLA